MYKLLSFDVYGTLINTPPINAKAFRLILEQAGGKPLGLTVCWINRRSIDLHPSVPPPDHIFTDIRSLLPLLGI